MADPGVLFVTGVFLPTATSGRGGSGSLGPAVPGLELDQLGQRERERKLRPGFAAAAWAGPSSLRLVPWHGSRPGGRRLGGRRVLGDPPSQARGASARPASGLCSDLGTSVLRAERLQPSALSGGDALCADWGGSRRTPWRPRSGDCGVLGLSGHLGSNQWSGPSLLRPSALSHSPPPTPTNSGFTFLSESKDSRKSEAIRTVSSVEHSGTTSERAQARPPSPRESAFSFPFAEPVSAARSSRQLVVICISQ